MGTTVAADRKMRVEEILGAFGMKAGGTVSGVAHGGSFKEDAPGAPIEVQEDVLVTESGDGPPARGTIMTIRVKKSDADAFAKGKLSLEDFRKKASITTYAGDTGSWGGGSVFETH